MIKTMYEPRRKVLWFSIISRLFIIFLQFIFNLLCPDHHADAFTSRINPNDRITNYDKTITILFGGLTRWDAQYFIHIARYGYTYENTLAFFPLYPISVRYVSRIIKKILFIFNDQSVVLLAAVLINFVCFVRSSVIFYDLSKRVLGNTTTAYKAAILYCINPASIFFTAAYSESMFAYLTFYSMIAAIKNNRFVCLPIGLSGIVRSNGLVNLGYPLYYSIQELFFFSLPKVISEYRHPSVQSGFISELLNFFSTLLWMFNTILLSLVPFILLQIYNYILFCTERINSTAVPSHVVNYGLINNLVMPGNNKLPWCEQTVPVAYSFVQEKYWNVGFLKYYQIKQLPNFCLAMPILYIMLKCAKEYFIENKRQLYNFEFLTTNSVEKVSITKRYPVQMFPFVVHGLFLTIFCILFVHIQVSTRLLGSASPLLYWFSAITMSHRVRKSDKDEYEINDNAYSKWKVFFMNQKKYTKKDKLFLIYFLGYTIIGCFMYSNFLPWT
ncbi:GPI mannosyltransferase 2 [Chelonus insularis]|uniref:GPI mannosyltransferase 2 n=1 Tax=Chelonus insularis TaxID=460826 RepID=UPI00158935BA|nr:GPI mannosyltransferase 2 [Chelonus insularis]XP_034943073.1 GPI mannosyltransferase 2 [Chelonus insularis]